MIDPHALRTLIEQWRTKAGRIIDTTEHHPDVEALALLKCAENLEALLSALPETPPRVFEHRGDLVAFVKEVRGYTNLSDAVDAMVDCLNWHNIAPPPPSEETA